MQKIQSIVDAHSCSTMPPLGVGVVADAARVQRALVTMLGGPATNTIVLLSSAEDWARYGKVQQALQDDPKMQAVLQEAGQIATWESYVSQTIPDV
jgi:hypothetical protein